MRTRRSRAPSNLRNPLDRATSRRVVGTFNRSRWLSVSAGLNPAALTGGLLVLAFVTVMKATSFAYKRWRSQRWLPTCFFSFSSFPRTDLSRTEAGTVVNLLFLAALVGGISGWLVVRAPAHEVMALLLAWMAFVCVACLLD
jgi:hypothetical protein